MKQKTRYLNYYRRPYRSFERRLLLETLPGTDTCGYTNDVNVANGESYGLAEPIRVEARHVTVCRWNALLCSSYHVTRSVAPIGLGRLLLLPFAKLWRNGVYMITTLFAFSLIFKKIITMTSYYRRSDISCPRKPKETPSFL